MGALELHLLCEAMVGDPTWCQNAASAEIGTCGRRRSMAHRDDEAVEPADFPIDRHRDTRLREARRLWRRAGPELHCEMRHRRELAHRIDGAEHRTDTGPLSPKSYASTDPLMQLGLRTNDLYCDLVSGFTHVPTSTAYTT